MKLDSSIQPVHEEIFTNEDPKKANELCNKLLKVNSLSNTNLAILYTYKSIALLKLYFGSKHWKNSETLSNIFRYLTKSLIMTETSDSANVETLGFIHFRYAILYFHLGRYSMSQKHMEIATHIYDFNNKMEPSLEVWEFQIQKKLDDRVGDAPVALDVNVFGEDDLQESVLDTSSEKEEKEEVAETSAQEHIAVKKDPVEKEEVAETSAQEHIAVKKDPVEEEAPLPTFKTDWYQTPETVTISLFTHQLPKTKEFIVCKISHNQFLEVSYPIPNTDQNSEFQYNAKLAFKVEPEVQKLFLGTKKLEITFKKLKAGHTWKSLEYVENQLDPNIAYSEQHHALNDTIKSPYTSKVDWNKYSSNISEDSPDAEEVGPEKEGGNDGGVDSFFKQLYKDADPDTQKAMMKSFLESNGTSLSTDWNDVKNRKVETAAPDGTVPKKW